MKPFSSASILMVISCLSFVARHDPWLATYTIQKQNGSWMMEINLSQEGAHRGLKQYYPTLNLDTLAEKEYKELMVEHIKETFQLVADKDTIRLGQGAIKLGSHETDLIFELQGMPDGLEKLSCHIACFSENERQVNYVKLQGRTAMCKVFLRANNDFSAQFLQDEDGNFEVLSP